MHKELNLFEYEITNEKKIELSTIQISQLLNDIFNDYDYFKYELDYQFLNIINEHLKDKKENEDKTTKQTKKKKTIKKRNYNTNAYIKILFDKYFNDTKTKKEVLELIADELSISYKAAEKAYYKKIN